MNKQNNSGETPIYRAVSLGESKYMKIFAKLGAESKCMKIFAKLGADVNIPDNHGVTPLMKVAKNLGSLRIDAPRETITLRGVGLALEKKEIHRTNLHYTELIRILLKSGARINCIDDRGRNALELACLHLIQRIVRNTFAFFFVPLEKYLMVIN